MSTDFIALFDVTLEVVTAEWLLENLASNPKFAAEIVEQYRDHWRPKTWAIAIKESPDGPAVYGPGGFAIRLRPRTLELYHMMRFSTFTADSSSRDVLRRACLTVTELVGSARAIYTHELMPHDGEGLSQIESGLRTHIAPPAATFAELNAADYFKPYAWYIDTFSDFRGCGNTNHPTR